MTPFSIATFADLGLMGHDGLSTVSGPIGGPDTVLGANETNTIQSLLAMKDTYEFMAHHGDIGYADYVSCLPYEKPPSLWRLGHPRPKRSLTFTPSHDSQFFKESLQGYFGTDNASLWVPHPSRGKAQPS